MLHIVNYSYVYSVLAYCVDAFSLSVCVFCRQKAVRTRGVVTPDAAPYAATIPGLNGVDSAAQVRRLPDA